jgi:hypothetical protein
MITVAEKWPLLRVVVIGQDKTKRDKMKHCTHIRHRWQNILPKLPEVIGQARKATTPSQAWSCLITDEKLDNIVQHTNRYILLQPNLSRACDDKIEIIAFICRLCLAGALRSNKQSLEELWATDGEGLEKFSVVLNCKRFKFLIRCTLEQNTAVSTKFLTFILLVET